MTATFGSSRRESAIGPLGAAGGEDGVFGLALVVLVVHAVVAAPLAGAALVVAAAPAAWIAFLRSGRAVRTLLAAALGVAALADGLAVHAAHAALDGPRPADATGVMVAVAGAALVALAFRLALRGRRRRAWALAVLVVLVVGQWVVVPLVTAGLATNARRGDVRAAASLGLAGARDVTFPARDGTRLAGWYVPGRTGAAVVVLHGSHGDRADTADHVRLLARAGYAVLTFDARGHGESQGDPNALGWRGVDDVAGAVGFVRRRPEVDPDRVAALGLSMGAEEALRAAGEGVALRAVVADGAGASTTGDARLVSGGLALSVQWMAMRATELLSGDREPRALREVVAGVRAPVLLVASGRAGERTMDDALRRRIGDGATLWSVGDAAHTHALDDHPHGYATRVESFLRGALGP